MHLQAESLQTCFYVLCIANERFLASFIRDLMQCSCSWTA